MKTQKKSMKGITLIALVITIIVLLILAGISITMLSGENSILKRATDAKKNTEDAQQEEQARLNEYADIMNTYTGGKAPDKTEGKLKGDELAAVKANGMDEVLTPSNTNLNNNENIEAVIKGKETINGKEVETEEIPIPKYATYKEGTESTGIVIEYKGSEFVWVPVPVNNNLCPKGTIKPMAKQIANSNYEGILYDFGEWDEDYNWIQYSDSVVMGEGNGLGTNGYREPDIVTTYDSDSQNYLKNIGFVKDNKSDPDAFKEVLIEDYRLMVESVKKYGGFYVGRYETSIDGRTVASKKSTEANEIMPMTAATGNQMWYGMYDKQKKFAGKYSATAATDSMQSSMIWGSQYDAMLNWMLTGSNDAKTRVGATTYGNHGGSTVGCGTYNVSNVYDVINKIYDLEGNVYEWTLEAYYATRRVLRGGSYHLARSPSVRSYDYPHYTYDNHGSRLSLYIK